MNRGYLWTRVAAGATRTPAWLWTAGYLLATSPRRRRQARGKPRVGVQAVAAVITLALLALVVWAFV